MSVIQYENTVIEKISSIINENRNIVSHSQEYDEKNNCLDITLIYNGFTAVLSFGEEVTKGYSFAESKTLGSSLITKFKFPFSKIPYSIYDIHNTVNDYEFVTYDFHCLYNKAAVKSAFDTVIAFINRNEKSIADIGSNDALKEKLESCYSHDLKKVSKKIKRENFEEKLEKNTDNHDIDLYFYRYGEYEFTNFIYKGQTKQLQKFYAKNSKKDTLLIYEERYLEHLFENDFKNVNKNFANEVKEQNAIAKSLEKKDSITFFIGFALSVAMTIIIAVIVESKLEEKYLLLKEVEINSIIPILIGTIGFTAMLYMPIDDIFTKFSKKHTSETEKNSISAYAITIAIGLVIVGTCGTYQYFHFQKNVGLGENDIYYCQSLGKTQILSYDDVRFYLIEGDYFDGNEYISTDDAKRIVFVKDDDYRDYFISDYLDYIEMPNSRRDSLNYTGKFKTLDDFEKKFNL